MRATCLKWPDQLAGESLQGKAVASEYFMHLICLKDVIRSEKKLTQAVLQITQMLGVYHAELARILRLQCADIGDLANAKKTIAAESEAWPPAIKYVEIFERLYYQCNGDEAKMNNWLRKPNKNLQAAPLYLMVDELKIEAVLKSLDSFAGNSGGNFGESGGVP